MIGETLSTPTDPYNSGSRRPFDDDDSILDPIDDTEGSSADDDQAAWDRAFNSDGDLDDEPTHTDDPARTENFDNDDSLGNDERYADDTEREVVLDEAIADDDREHVGGDHAESRAGDEPVHDETVAHDDNPTLGGYIADRNGDADREDGPDAERHDLDGLATERDLGDDHAESRVDAHTDDEGNYNENRYDADRQDANVDPAEERRGPNRTSVMGAATAAPVAAAASQTPADTPTETHTDTTRDNRAFMAASTPQDADERRERWSADLGEDALAEDVPEEPKGRGLAHVGALLLTLLLVPVAWYLIADAGARLSAVAGNPWDTGTVQIMPLLELLGGFVVLAVIWLMARASSLGAQIIGGIVAIAGVVALVVPKLGNDVVQAVDNAIGGYNDFTGNVVYHLGNDLGSGRIATFGLLLFLTGLVAHGARRRGQHVATALTRRHFLLGDQATKKD